MTKKISNKTFKYDFNSIHNAFSDYTTNLSSMKYVYNPNGNTKGIEQPLFKIGTCIEVEELIKIHKKQNTYHIEIHPYIKEIAPVFKYDLKDEYSNNEEKINKICNEYKKNIYSLIGNIYQFAKNRYLTLTQFTNEDFKEISPYGEENQEEILKVLNYFIRSLPRKELSLNDYYFDDNLKKPDENHKYILKTSSVYNYQTLRKELIKFVTRENEYYNSFHDRKKIEEVLEKEKIKAEKDTSLKGIQQSIKALNCVLKKYDEIIDYLNNSPYFSRETFAIMCIKLESFIEKEKAIDNFIDKILNDCL